MEEAIEVFEVVLEHDPSMKEAYSNLAHCLNVRGDHAGALTNCEAALRLDPEFVEATSNKGIALLGLVGAGGQER